MVLDGVAPTDMRLPLFAARDAQRALDKLLDRLRRRRRPARRPSRGWPSGRRRCFARLDADAARTVRLVHPRTGVAEDVDCVERRSSPASLFGALYSPLTASILPALIERAEHDDFQGLLALAFAGEGATDNMSVGMQLSVLCSEDSPRYTPGDLAPRSRRHAVRRRIC